MGRELLVREVKAAALARMEDAARTKDDFKAVIVQWNQNDGNRERRERYHEIGRPNAEMLHWDKQIAGDEKGKIKEVLDIVIPCPLVSMWWRQLMRGDFLDTIYDNALEMWQLVEDWDVAVLVKSLTAKQKEVLFLSAVRRCTAAQIACYNDKTDRAIRKLLAAALHSIRDQLAPRIRKQLEVGSPQMTLAKREFLAWYDHEKAAVLDSDRGG